MIFPCVKYITFTLHLLHLHYIYTAFTLHSHYIHTTFTLHLHNDGASSRSFERHFFQCCKTKLVVFRGIFSLLPLHHSHPEELPNLILGLRRTTAEMLTGLESSSIVRSVTE